MEEPAPTPTVRAPETTDDPNVRLEVNGGPLEEGTRATIYRYQAGWDGGEPDCTSSNVETRELTLDGSGEYQPIDFRTITGMTYWVLSAGDYVTPCGDAYTTVKVATSVSVFTGQETTPVGEDREITVEITSTPTDVPVTGTATVLGPWSSAPEADAASCENSPEVMDAPLEFDYGLISPTARFTVTPDAPGVYRVIVETVENDQNAPVNTCTNGDAKVMTFTVAGE
ncbi:hypothetical protein [Microbacterium sp.]|uniref:hypothetical protein n=1 Tax=Microbacterium sp. TaxID=51671 RepID=UPI003F9873DD